MWANVENDAGKGSVSSIDDRNILHRRSETRCRHVGVVVMMLAVNSYPGLWQTIFTSLIKHKMLQRGSI